jgi:hypothetical protein
VRFSWTDELFAGLVELAAPVDRLADVVVVGNAAFEMEIEVGQVVERMKQMVVLGE